MILLQNHTKALRAVSDMTGEQLRKQFGNKEKVTGYIIGAVYNSDLYRKKEDLLRIDPAGIAAGLAAWTKMTGAKGAGIITLADEKIREPLLDYAREAGLSLNFEEESMFLRTKHRDDLFVSFDELQKTALMLEKFESPETEAADAQKQPENPEVGSGSALNTMPVLLCIYGDEKDGECCELFEADPEENLESCMISHAPHSLQNPEEWKAILCDHAFYTPEQIRAMKVKDLPERSGVIRILDRKSCMVDQTLRELKLLQEKSCGRCTFCREGLNQLAGRFAQVGSARAKGTEMDLAKEIAEAMHVSFHCSLGEDAPMPVLSVLANFPEEINAHIRQGVCPAGVCQAFCRYYIDPSACTGAGACAEVCPSDAVGMKSGYTSVIDTFACTRCGACLTACTGGAVHFTYNKIPGNARTAQRLKRRGSDLKDAGSASALEAQVMQNEPNGAAGSVPGTDKETAEKTHGARRRRTFAKPVKK